MRVTGVADALRTASGGGMRLEDLHIEPARIAAARFLSEAELKQAWSEGQALGFREAIDAAHSLRSAHIDRAGVDDAAVRPH